MPKQFVDIFVHQARERIIIMPLPRSQSDNHKARRKAKRAKAKAEGHPINEMPKRFVIENSKEECLNNDNVIPEVSDLDVAFPARWRELLPAPEELTQEDNNWNDPFHRAVSSLFSKGGTLEEFGIYPKPGYDVRKVMRYIKATLGDWGPKHEHKIGGIAHMLRIWCDYRKPQS
jgi:hypothetical protein